MADNMADEFFIRRCILKTFRRLSTSSVTIHSETRSILYLHHTAAVSHTHTYIRSATAYMILGNRKKNVINRKPCEKNYSPSSSFSWMAIFKSPPPVPAADNLYNADHRWCKHRRWPCMTSPTVLGQPCSWHDEAQEQVCLL